MRKQSIEVLAAVLGVAIGSAHMANAAEINVLSSNAIKRPYPNSRRCSRMRAAISSTPLARDCRHSEETGAGETSIGSCHSSSRPDQRARSSPARCRSRPLRLACGAVGATSGSFGAKRSRNLLSARDRHSSDRAGFRSRVHVGAPRANLKGSAPGLGVGSLPWARGRHRLQQSAKSAYPCIHSRSVAGGHQPIPCSPAAPYGANPDSARR